MKNDDSGQTVVVSTTKEISCFVVSLFYNLVCFSAEACAILLVLCRSRKHQQVCHFSSFFLLSNSRSVITVLSFPPSFLLPQSLWQIWQELSSLCSCFIRIQWSPDTRFSRETTRLISWPDGNTTWVLCNPL